MGPQGGSGALQITTERECQWTVQASQPWIKITAGSSGQGAGTVSYTVSANGSPVPRSAGIAIGDQEVRISQEALTCRFDVGPTEVTLPAAGGEANIDISADQACAWTAAPDADWIAVSADHGTGPDTVSLQAGPNAGAARSATVAVGGHSVTVTQSGSIPGQPGACAPGVAPSGFTDVAASGASLEVMVSAPAGCPWTSSSGISWIQVTGSGTGAGAATLTVGANAGAARSGAVTVAGKTITVAQAAAAAPPPGPQPCTFSISPTTFDAVSAGGSKKVSVTAPKGCSWSVSDIPDWITATPGGGTGNGSVTVAATANPGSARSATLTIAARPFVVNQAAGCGFQLSPDAIVLPAIGGLTTVAVLTNPGCSWNVGGSPSWAAATPDTGSGPAAVVITLEPNTGGARSATLHIGGADLQISQDAAACSYSVSPASLDLSREGQTATIDVTTGAACPVSARSNVPWITIKSAPSHGGGAVVLDVKRNGDHDRSGTVTIEGQDFSQDVAVTQERR